MSTTYTDIDDVLPVRILASVNPRVDDASDSIRTIKSVRQSTDMINVNDSLITLSDMGLCLIPYTKNNYDPSTMMYNYIVAYPLGKKLFARLRFVALHVSLDDKLIAGYYKLATKSFKRNFVQSNIVTLNYNPACITRSELRDIILNLKAELNIEAFNDNVNSLMNTIENCVRLTPADTIRIRDDTVVFKTDFIFKDKNLENTYNYITDTLKCTPEFKIIL